MKKLINDFISLFYPDTCKLCGHSLFNNEKLVCMSCQFHLPKTNYHLDDDNPVIRTFWGRVEIENASAFLYFRKGGKVQKLMHEFKYKGQKELGILIGKWHAIDIMNTEWIKDIDLIIPIPLHAKKQLKRGFNQSEYYAMGLADILNKAFITSSLVRTKASETQTRKSRFKRWENVHDIFSILNPELIKNKHILLVDDVLTTGATLEAAAMKILLINNTRVSILTMAFVS